MEELQLKQIRNRLFNSNTYILFREHEEKIWLVDCGDYDKVKAFCDEHGKYVAGLFITHSHFDHVYGVNDLLQDYPDVPVYLSVHGGKEIIADTKRNGSKYAEIPFIVQTPNFVEVDEGNKVLLWNSSILTVLNTAGHSSDSISFTVGSLLFTGDALIPNIRTVTKIRGACRSEAIDSLKRLYDYMDDATLICPGHNDLAGKRDILDIEKMF